MSKTITANINELNMEPELTETEEKKSLLKRLLPLGVIGGALGAFFVLGGPEYVSLEYLEQQRAVLSGYVQDNFLMAMGGFILLYAILVGISFPGAGFLSIFGGFLFGTFTGGFGNVIGATIGACAIYAAVKFALGDSMAKKMGPYMEKFETGLKQNELSYLFILRLVPLFPFFVVNVIPALFDVKFRNYLLSTLFGIIPGSLVYASIGASAGAIFDQGDELSLKGAMTEPNVLFAVTGLIALSLVPIIYKKLSKAPSA